MKINYLDQRALSGIYNTKKYLQSKTIEDIPKSALKAIHLISLPIDEPGVPFGSYVNRMSDYYGDIDVIQLADEFKSVATVGPEAAKAIQSVVKEIAKTPNHWYSEVKAGIDHIYNLDIGDLVNGVYRVNKKLMSQVKELYDMKLLDSKEFNIIKTIASKKTGAADDYDVVFNMLREHWLLRWDIHEILQGWKEISGKRKYKLSEAVIDKSAVKIDMVIYSATGKFLEVTNFIALGVKKDGYFKPINVDYRAINPGELPPEVEKLYFSNFYYSPFKMVKRAFSYLKWRAKNNPNNKAVEVIVGKYIKILKTSIGILYSVNSELDAIRIALEKDYKGVITKVNKRLDLIKDPLSNVLELDQGELSDVFKLLEAVKAATGDKKLYLLGQLREIFRQVINFWTIAYFDQLGINPPPKIILPKQMTYNPHLYREPWSNPVNPFKVAKKGGCAECNGTCGGSWFTDVAGSIFRGVANAYRRNFCNGKARPLLKGEYHFGCHNFTGPGTRVDLKSVRDYKPYNDIDACSRQHDLDYTDAIELPDKERINAINKADKDAVECYKKYPNENGANVAKMGINSKMTLAKVLPLVSKSVFGKISASGKNKKSKNKKGISSVEEGKKVLDL